MRFEDVDVWKRAARLAAETLREFGDSREFAFKDPISRSALSIASNVAEGYERDTARDRIKFLHYARGSCGELRTQILIGIEAGYVSAGRGKHWARETREISAMLLGLIRAWR